MNKDDIEQQKILKVLKYQETKLGNLDTKNSETINQLERSITGAESILKELGYNIKKDDLPKVKSVHNKKEITTLRSWNEIAAEAESNVNFEVSFLDLLSEEDVNNSISRINLLREEFNETSSANCDKYDYVIAATCGTIGSLIDVFFVAVPGEGAVGQFTDKLAGNAVEKFASFLGWDNKKALQRGSNTTKSAIGFLEGKFKVNYDQRHGGDVGRLFKMSTKNHHLKSLAHSPSIIGLFFSILNQLTNTASFVSDAKIITIDTEIFELAGSNLVSKIYAGFVNWIGHIISDLSGSSGAAGRGSGVPIPFYELLQFFNFGSFGQHRQSFATIAVKVFEQGYDLRHGAAMAIPVIVTELLVRIMWTLKSHYYHNKSWEESVHFVKNPNLARMLFTAHGCFCLLDLADAAVSSGGVAVQFLLRMNLVAWVRFGKLGIDEVYVFFSKEGRRHKYVMGKVNEEWVALDKNLAHRRFLWKLLSSREILL